MSFGNNNGTSSYLLWEEPLARQLAHRSTAAVFGSETIPFALLRQGIFPRSAPRSGKVDKNIFRLD
jgi:hypothetical protein